MNSRLNLIFNGMKVRCYNKKHGDYKRYGAKGITICDEWYTPKSHDGWRRFKKWALENGYNDSLSIDRIDNSKGYSPENCRWVSKLEQNNNKGSNKYIFYNGEAKTISQWSKILGVNYTTLYARLTQYDFDVEKAFSSKVYTVREITYKGKTQTVAEWCRELGLKYSTVTSRLNKLGWSVEKALTD